MAELTISAAVGAAPAPNRADDIRTVQTLLQNVQPPLSVAVTVTGILDPNTQRAIREFQRRFMNNPDGRVDPDGRTLFHLNNGSAPQYQGCSAQRRVTLDRDLINAQAWLDTVNRRLGNTHDSDLKRKVKNVFHIDLDNLSDRQESLHFQQLRTNFRKLRMSMDDPFPLQCEQGSSLFAAWVDINDPTGTMHFPPGHFSQSSEQRIETIIHERAHTVFHIGHDGMSGAGEIDFGQSPDDDNGFTFRQSLNNAYCYGWLSTSLQPGYIPPADEVITVPIRRP